MARLKLNRDGFGIFYAVVCQGFAALQRLNLDKYSLHN